MVRYPMKRNAQWKSTASKSRKVCLTIAPQILMVNQPFLHLNCHKLRYPHLLNRSISRVCWFTSSTCLNNNSCWSKFRIFHHFKGHPFQETHISRISWISFLYGWQPGHQYSSPLPTTSAGSARSAGELCCTAGSNPRGRTNAPETDTFLLHGKITSKVGRIVQQCRFPLCLFKSWISQDSHHLPWSFCESSQVNRRSHKATPNFKHLYWR